MKNGGSLIQPYIKWIRVDCAEFTLLPNPTFDLSINLLPKPNMKKLVLVAGLIITVAMSSCTFEAYQCPAYSHTVKSTKSGVKAQERYARKKF